MTARSCAPGCASTTGRSSSPATACGWSSVICPPRAPGSTRSSPSGWRARSGWPSQRACSRPRSWKTGSAPPLAARGHPIWSNLIPLSRNQRKRPDLALDRSGVTPPYVLVGHSSGGLNMRVYAARYPEEVAGMVLVDAAHEDQRVRVPRRALAARLADWADWQVYHLNPLLARLGVLRV